MDFEALARGIWAQFVTVWATPVPFIAAMIAGYFLLRWYISGQFATRLANAESTEKLLERQLQEYKDKTGSETPDAVKARIDALETRLLEMGPLISAMGPRKVSAEQRKQMVPALDPFRGTLIEISTDAASADAAQLSKGLISAFNSAGWLTGNGMVMGLGNPPPSGIGLRVEDPDNLTPPQVAIVSALRAGGLDFDLQAGKPGLGMHEVMGMSDYPLPAAVLTLTTRLAD